MRRRDLHDGEEEEEDEYLLGTPARPTNAIPASAMAASRWTVSPCCDVQPGLASSLLASWLVYCYGSVRGKPCRPLSSAPAMAAAQAAGDTDDVVVIDRPSTSTTSHAHADDVVVVVTRLCPPRPAWRCKQHSAVREEFHKSRREVTSTLHVTNEGYAPSPPPPPPHGSPRAAAPASRRRSLKQMEGLMKQRRFPTRWS